MAKWHCRMENMELAFKNQFKGVYQGKRVLVTGHTGFKGSWLSIWLKALGAEVYGFALEADGPNANFNRCGLAQRMHHTLGDIRNQSLLQDFVSEIKPHFIFHLAAQPLVLESYNNPHYNFETNVMGTVNILEAVKNCPSVEFLINVTTDKCYQNKEWLWGYRESEALGGEDPYSASKACSEIITHAYRQSFFKQHACSIASARAGNVIGGGDWAENRIIPDAFRALQMQKTLQIRNPNAIRPWQFVLEPLMGYLTLGMHLALEGSAFAEAWNFGPLSSEPYSVKQIIELLQNQIPQLKVEFHHSHSAPHEAALLQLDVSKALHRLAWKPRLNMKQTLEFTTRGYLQELKHSGDLYTLRLQHLHDYCSC